MVWAEPTGNDIIVPGDRDPSATPAQDSRDYVRITGDIPVELQPYVDTAIVFYRGTFDPSLPSQQFKYFGFGGRGGTFFQFCYVYNFAGTLGDHRLVNMQSFTFDQFDRLVATFGAYDQVNGIALADANYIVNTLRPLDLPDPVNVETINAFQPGWFNFGFTYPQLHYWKDVNGMGNLYGVIKANGGLAANQDSPITVLPTLLRPTAPHLGSVTAFTGSGIILARVDVQTDGTVRWLGNSVGIGASNYLSFDHYRWPTKRLL